MTMEKELANEVCVPVVMVKMGSHERKAFSMDVKNWSSEVCEDWSPYLSLGANMCTMKALKYRM